MVQATTRNPFGFGENLFAEKSVPIASGALTSGYLTGTASTRQIRISDLNQVTSAQITIELITDAGGASTKYIAHVTAITRNLITFRGYESGADASALDEITDAVDLSTYQITGEARGY